MSGYAITNLSRVKDSAVEFGYSEMQEARFPREDVGAERTGFAVHFVRPGKRSAFGHRHDDAEEVHLVVRGSGRVRLDDEIVELSERDVLRVAPGVTRAFEGGPEGLEYVVFGARHERDGELVEGFWPA